MIIEAAFLTLDPGSMRKPAVAVAVGLSVTLGGLAPAYAVDGDPASTTITATVTAGSVGSRTVVATPVTMSSALNSATLSSSLAATVTEAARTGTNPWSLTASSTDLTSGANTITKDNLTMSAREVVQVAGGGTAAATSGSQDMSATRTLFSNSGQSTSALYTGTYASTSTLSLALPNGTATGAYTATVTITLVQ